MLDYTFHTERFDQTYAEFEPLYRAHFAEMRGYKRHFGILIGDYDLDTQGYFDMAKAGQLISYVVRHAGAPVGYLHVYLMHDHRTGELVASDDSLFVTPEHRCGIGRKLVQYAVAEIRKTGARRLDLTLSGDRRVGKLLARLGFKPSALQMTLTL